MEEPVTSICARLEAVTSICSSTQTRHGEGVPHAERVPRPAAGARAGGMARAGAAAVLECREWAGSKEL